MVNSPMSVSRDDIAGSRLRFIEVKRLRWVELLYLVFIFIKFTFGITFNGDPSAESSRCLKAPLGRGVFP